MRWRRFTGGRLSGCALLLLALSADGIGCATTGQRPPTTAKGKAAMNEQIQLYSWTRDGASIYLARIAQMNVRPGPPGQEIISLRIHIEETLWGQPGAMSRRSELTRSASETTRLKFPDPVWGRVELQEGALILLVTHEIVETLADPLYVEQANDPNDPVLLATRAVLKQVKVPRDEPQSVDAYLGWLTQGSTVAKLFGAEALAKDPDLPSVDREGRVAAAFSNAFLAERDLFVRLSVGAWMWDHIFARTNPAGQVLIINASIKAAEEDLEDIRRFALDRLTTVASVHLEQPAITKSPEATRRLQERFDQETDPEARKQIKKVIDALRN